MSRILKVMALIVPVLGGPALAHEEGDRAMGVVQSLTPDRIVIQTSDGHAVSFTVDAETSFFVGEKHVTAAEVRPGQRAVVHGKRRGVGLTAVRVKLAPPRK
jgi:hypothetical protein